MQNPACIWVNLFVGEFMVFRLNNKNTGKAVTDYPWDGKVRFLLFLKNRLEFDLHIRCFPVGKIITGPGDTYHYLG